MKLIARDFVLITAATTIVAIVTLSVASWRLALPAVTGMAIVSFLIVLCYRHLVSLVKTAATEQTRESLVHYRQLEATIWLSSIVKMKQPPAFMRGMAISPDFGVLLAQALFSHRPHTVVELGCGTSTLLCSYILEQLGGEGHVVSIDHDEKFAAICRQQLMDHGLEHRAKIYHCPLVSQTVDGVNVQYYDLGRASLPERIDVLIVDGPPQWIGRMARYPALPLLAPLLDPRAIVLIDDAGRPDEKSMVKRWLTDHPELEERYEETEKGTAILRQRQG